MNPLGKSASLSKQPFRVALLFPASTSRIRVGSSWAGKESYLSLVDGTCTHIRPRVQPFPIVGLGWLAYVRTVYRDSANNESHSPIPLVFKTVRNSFPLHGSSMVRCLSCIPVTISGSFLIVAMSVQKL